MPSPLSGGSRLLMRARVLSRWQFNTCKKYLQVMGVPLALPDSISFKDVFTSKLSCELSPFCVLLFGHGVQLSH